QQPLHSFPTRRSSDLQFMKQIRERQRLGLREFCLENGYDPSNWSKIEREVLPPPRDEVTLRTWAKQLGLRQGGTIGANSSILLRSEEHTSELQSPCNL